MQGTIQADSQKVLELSRGLFEVKVDQVDGSINSSSVSYIQPGIYRSITSDGRNQFRSVTVEVTVSRWCVLLPV